jgi:hypothetical protein
MTIGESKTIKVDLHYPLAGLTSAGPVQLSPGFARLDGNISGRGCHCIASADLPCPDAQVGPFSFVQAHH